MAKHSFLHFIFFLFDSNSKIFFENSIGKHWGNNKKKATTYYPDIYFLMDSSNHLENKFTTK